MPVTKFKPVTELQTCLAIGIDLSPSSIAGCAKGYDRLTQKFYGPAWTIRRWSRDFPFLERVKEVAKAHEYIIELITQTIKVVDLECVFIGVEEAWPGRMMNVARARQQAEINGAFLGGLLRYGYKNVFQVNAKAWHNVVAFDFDVKQNKDFGKFTVREWVKEVYGAEWPDLIQSKDGLISKPRTSKAKPAQPDDRVDATGIAEYVFEKAQKELKKDAARNRNRSLKGSFREITV